MLDIKDTIFDLLCLIFGKRLINKYFCKGSHHWAITDLIPGEPLTFCVKCKHIKDL